MSNKSGINNLVICGNPKDESLGLSIANSIHQKNIDKQESSELISVKKSGALNKEQWQEAISKADMLHIVTPVYWGSIPWQFKKVFDEVFTPGFAFKNVSGGGMMPIKLLSGKKAKLTLTFDMPKWLFILTGAPVVFAMILYTFMYVGINIRGLRLIDKVYKRSEEEIEGLLK